MSKIDDNNIEGKTIAKRRTLFLLFLVSSVVFVTAACVFYVLWKLGIGEWTFLAFVICTIVGVTALLYTVAQLENEKTKKSHRRIGVLLFTELILIAAGMLFSALAKIGVGEWAESVSMLLIGFVMLGPPVWFIIQPDLAITTFNAFTGNINASDDWKALSPLRRAAVYIGTLLFLAIGVLLIVVAFNQLLSG